MTTLSGQTFLCFVGDDYEDLEIWYPKLRLIEAGAAFHLAGQEAGKKYIGKNGYPCVSDIPIRGITVAGYHGLICAGGWMPDKLRRDPEVLRIIREFAQSGKLVAAICHGGWMPISAGVCDQPGPAKHVLTGWGTASMIGPVKSLDDTREMNHGTYEPSGSVVGFGSAGRALCESLCQTRIPLRDRPADRERLRASAAVDPSATGVSGGCLRG